MKGFLSFATVSEPHKLGFVDFLSLLFIRDNRDVLRDRTTFAFFFFFFSRDILISFNFCFSHWKQLFVMHPPKYFWACRMALLEIPLPQAKAFLVI